MQTRDHARDTVDFFFTLRLKFVELVHSFSSKNQSYYSSVKTLTLFWLTMMQLCFLNLLQLLQHVNLELFKIFMNKITFSRTTLVRVLYTGNKRKKTTFSFKLPLLIAALKIQLME